MPTTKTRSSLRTRKTRSANGSAAEPSKSSNGKKSKSENGSEQESSQLEKLFTDSLKDIYWAEKQLTKALPRLRKAATSPDLAMAFEDHLQVTQNHVARLEQIFALMDEKPETKKM